MNVNTLISIHYPYINANLISELTGLSTSQIYNRAYSLGIRKHPRFKQDDNRRKVLMAGANSRFKPGHISHNKGQKMTPEMYAKAKPTMYKKGQKPLNTKPLHTINIRLDSKGFAYSYLKLGDCKWVLLHRHIYEQAHGPVPKGSIVIFKDGNRTNFELSNLEMVTTKQNMLRNTLHQWPAEIKTIIKLKNKLNKTIKTHGKQSDKRS